MLAVMIGLLAVGAGRARGEVLSLTEAERLAFADDPRIAGFGANAMALDAKSIADGELPDPELRLGIMNWPIQTFDRAKEPMNKIEVGLRQVFPRGRTWSLRTQRTASLAEVERRRGRAEAAKLLLAVRLDWLELFHLEQVLEIVLESRSVFQQIIQITESLYGVGRQNQQDVLRARLELRLLEDRELDINRRVEQARARLAKWIGPAASRRPMPPTMPVLPTPAPADDILAGLAAHPEVAISDAELEARHAGVDLANEAYKPEWSLDLAYGYRGDDISSRDRSDLFSVMVMVDLPLFTERRQDQRLSAAKHKAAQAMFQRDDRLRELRRMLDEQYAAWRRLGERENLYEQAVIEEADNTFEASLRAYQNDVTDFTAVMRDELTKFKSLLELHHIRIDRAMAHAKLLYLQR